MTLVEFLLARIAEDEAVALAAEPGPWYVDSEEQTVRAREYAGEIMFDRSCDGRFEWEGAGKPNAEFIARHDPTRVLAECAAKRKLIRWVNLWPTRPAPPSSVDGILEILAGAYKDHPDYRQEWQGAA